MARSMTGFGAYEECDSICVQHWEIKSLNSKNLSVRFKIPSYLRPVEHIWLKEVKKVACRGNIEVYLNVKILRPDQVPFSVNETLLDLMFQCLDNYAKSRGEIFVPDYNKVLSMSSLWIETPVSGGEELVLSLEKGLKLALESWNDFRIREGLKLVQDLKKRVSRLCEIRDKIKELSKPLVQEKFQSLKSRILDLLNETSIQLNEERLLQELSIMADKLDISEELVRLDTHLGAIKSTLELEEGIGRPLDFLMQECFREINTLGNKAQSAKISGLVVEFKTELEKCREQVQNLE